MDTDFSRFNVGFTFSSLCRKGNTVNRKTNHFLFARTGSWKMSWKLLDSVSWELLTEGGQIHKLNRLLVPYKAASLLSFSLFISD